jgi:hypothetical protein
MGDQTALVKVGIKRLGLLEDFDQPRTRVALDLACAEDMRHTMLNDAKHCRQVAALAKRYLKDAARAVLDYHARLRGYRTPTDVAEPGYGKRSAFLQSAPAGYQGFVPDSRYSHLPDAPPIDPKITEAGRSKYADLPEPPKTPTGELDLQRLNEMNGHGNSRVNPRWR